MSWPRGSSLNGHAGPRSMGQGVDDDVDADGVPRGENRSKVFAVASLALPAVGNVGVSGSSRPSDDPADPEHSLKNTGLLSEPFSEVCPPLLTRS